MSYFCQVFGEIIEVKTALKLDRAQALCSRYSMTLPELRLPWIVVALVSSCARQMANLRQAMARGARPVWHGRLPNVGAVVADERLDVISVLDGMQRSYCVAVSPL